MLIRTVPVSAPTMRTGLQVSILALLVAMGMPCAGNAADVAKGFAPDATSEPSFRIMEPRRSSTPPVQSGRPASPSTSTNLRVTYDALSQTETSIAADPNNPLIIVGGMNHQLQHGDMRARPGVVYSHDGGASFTHHPTGIQKPDEFNAQGGDPSLAFDSQGRVYYASVGVAFGPLYFTVSNGIFVSRSDDGGANWSTAVAVAANVYVDASNLVNFEDKPMITVDAYPGSPYRDRIYVTWTRFYAGYYPESSIGGGGDIMLAYSSDAGTTWSTPIRLTDPAHQPQNGGTGSAPTSFVQGPEPAVGPDGSVYVIYQYGGRTDVQRSTDGGETFGMPTQPFGWAFNYNTRILDHDASVSGRQLPDLTFRSNDWPNMEVDPVRPGYLYAVNADDPDNTTSGDGADIVFARSTDFGATWESRITVNDDGDSASQIFPWMAVSASGVIRIIWYDTRLAPEGNELDVYSAVSFDGGATFAGNVRVTDTTFDPNTGQFPADVYFGDYNALTVTGETFYALWADARDAEHELYLAAIDACMAPINPDFEDSDGDLAVDPCDNCLHIANAAQAVTVMLTGDINEDGSHTSADIIGLVNYIFKSGLAPVPCAASGDVNCTGDVTSADIIGMVNYIFKGGDQPCDICAAAGLGWTCP